MPRTVFRTRPSDELVNQSLRALGISGLDGTEEVGEIHMDGALVAAVIEGLRGVYFPCMFKRYVKDDMTYKDYLVIVRQLLKTRNRIFRRREKCFKIGEKTYQYLPYYSLVPGTRQDFTTPLSFQ